MSSNALSDLKILFLIPRRGGHSEVLSLITIETSSESLDPEDFIKHFINYQKKVFTKEVVMEIGRNILKEFKLTNLTLDIKFSLPVDRLSVDLNDSTCFILDCGYRFKYDEKESVSMYLACPVRVYDIFTIEGRLSVGITNPSPNLYFEDILDLIIKYGKVVIYPLTCTEDKILLEKEIDKGKSVRDYLDFLKIALIKREMAENGWVDVEFSEIYKLYKVKKSVEW